MQSESSIATSALRIAVTALICMLFAVSASAQQSYVSRYDAFAGFSYFDSPKVSLQETGYHLQAGIRILTFTPNLLLNGEKYA